MTTAEILAEAFEHDPVFAWLLPDSRTRRARLRRYFALETAHITGPHGQDVIEPDGVCLVLPPGHWRAPLRTQLPHGAGFTRAFGLRLPKAAALLTAMEAKHLREPHVYLPYIGVAPHAQGRGLGAQLIERAFRADLPTYLEASNPDCARLYRRLGFRTTSTIRPFGSPPIELMRRPCDGAR